MNILDDLLSGVPIAPLALVRQLFPRSRLDDVAATVWHELCKPEILAAVKPGDSVAVTVGSRGIANLPLIIREIVAILKQAGAKPFIVPAMGSHGGATSAGQTHVLAGLGITAAAVCTWASSREGPLKIRTAKRRSSLRRSSSQLVSKPASPSGAAVRASRTKRSADERRRGRSRRAAR